MTTHFRDQPLGDSATAARLLSALVGRLLAGAALFAGTALTPPTASAQDWSGVVQPVKPLVMVLLDTSGSMEYMAGSAGVSAQEFTVPLCHEPGEVRSELAPGYGGTHDYDKSRLVVAKEALTGTIKDYWCEYDYRDDDENRPDYLYQIPHVRACSGQVGETCRPPEQSFNGVLDVFRDSTRFAMGTFDSIESLASDPEGMWSYGPPKGGINIGLRNAKYSDPIDKPDEFDVSVQDWVYDDDDRALAGLTNNLGQLVGVPNDDSFQSLRAQNRGLQKEVMSTVGYFGTPLSPAIEDANWYLTNDPATRPYDPGSGVGDRFFNCREKYVVLITDGRASQGEGVGGYVTTSQAITKMKNQLGGDEGLKFFVVGFNLEDQATVASLQNLDQANGGPADKVFIASTTSQLREDIALIIGETEAKPKVRTPSVFTNATRNALDKQYQFSASYMADPDYPLRLEGYIDQTVYGCGGECITTSDDPSSSCAVRKQEPDLQLTQVENQSTRRFFTRLDTQTVQMGDGLETQADSLDDAVKKFGLPMDEALPVVLPTDFEGGANDVPVFDGDEVIADAQTMTLDDGHEYLRQLFKHLRADTGSMRQAHKMGAIFHTTPTLHEPPRLNQYGLRSWRKYVGSLLPGAPVTPYCRPTMMYVGTSMGFIHAFRVDAFDNNGPCSEYSSYLTQNDEQITVEGHDDFQGTGEFGQTRTRNVWSFMPQHLLRQAHNVVGQHHFLMDGQIVVKDVMLERGNPEPVAGANEVLDRWASVLVAGYGIGGRGYVALDVSDPLAAGSAASQSGPPVLWELDNKRLCGQDGAGVCKTSLEGNTYDFRYLGLTKPRAAFGTAIVNGKEKAIVLLSGGDSTEDPAEPLAGRALYVVEADTGKKVAEFHPESNNVFGIQGAPMQLDAAMTGAPVVYSDVPGVVSTRAFVGDAKGRMWRLDMRSDSPSDWQLRMFYDPYAPGEPGFALQDDSRQPVFDAPTLALASADGELVISYGTGDIDYLTENASSTGVVVSVREFFEGSSALDGVYVGIRNWAQVLEPNERLTGPPIIYDRVAYFTTFSQDLFEACDAGTGRLYGLQFLDNDGAGGAQAALDEDGDPTTADIVPFTDLGEIVPLGVQIVERPACFETAGTPQQVAQGDYGGAGVGAVQRGQLQLVVNTAQGKALNNATAPPGLNAENMRAPTLNLGLAEDGQTVQSAAWGYVLY